MSEELFQIVLKKISLQRHSNKAGKLSTCRISAIKYINESISRNVMDIIFLILFDIRDEN